MNEPTLTLETFLDRLDRVPWLQHLGQPTDRDGEVHRIHDWDEWPGPEEPNIAELGLWWQDRHDAVLAQAGADRAAAEGLFNEVQAKVFDRAKAAVPYDPEQDAWHGPTQCVWDVSYWAGLVALYLQLGQPLPDQIKQVWSWVEAGHWPCGFDEDMKLMIF